MTPPRSSEVSRVPEVRAGEDVPHEREAVAVQPARRDRDHDVAVLHAVGAEHGVCLDHADRGSGDVVVVRAEQAGVLGRSRRRRARCRSRSTPRAMPAHDVGDALGHDLAAGDVVGHEQRLRARPRRCRRRPCRRGPARSCRACRAPGRSRPWCRRHPCSSRAAVVGYVAQRATRRTVRRTRRRRRALRGRACSATAAFISSTREVTRRRVDSGLCVAVGCSVTVQVPLYGVRDYVRTALHSTSVIWSTVACAASSASSHRNPVNQQVYDASLLLQHRGQDSTGIATSEGSILHMHKAKGQVREAYRTRDMRSLLGTMGLGHVRYATRGDASNEAGGAAVLRERALRHRARAQRQPDEHARARPRSSSTSTAAT